MSALAPLYIKTVYKDEPSFRDVKIVFSVYKDDFKNKLSQDFASKIMMKDLAGIDLSSVQGDVDYAGLLKLAIDYSDGVIQNSEHVDLYV